MVKVIWHWSDTGTVDVNKTTVTQSFLKPGSYYVRLTLAIASGCVVTDSVLVKVYNDVANYLDKPILNVSAVGT